MRRIDFLESRFFVRSETECGGPRDEGLGRRAREEREVEPCVREGDDIGIFDGMPVRTWHGHCAEDVYALSTARRTSEKKLYLVGCCKV